MIAYRRREVEAPGEVSLSIVNSKENRGAVRIAAKTVRVITVPPVMALALFTVLWLHGGIIGQVRDYICSVVLLVVLPVWRTLCKDSCLLSGKKAGRLSAPSQ